MAIEASEAVPIPASIITGTETESIILWILSGSIIPRPLPIGAASGIIETQPKSSNFLQLS